MRSRCSFILFVLVLFRTSAAWGQQPVSVDPYEVLYGRRLALPKRPAPEGTLKPSPPVIAAVQTRTDTLLARIGAISAAFGSQSNQASVREFSESLRKDHAAILALRNKDKHFAASWKASQQFLFAEFLTGLGEAILKEAAQDASGGQGSLSRIPELRAKIDALRARILLARPASPGAALAIVEAHANWVGMTALLDLIQNRPAEFYALIEPLNMSVKPEERERFLRWMVEPLLVPAMQWWLDETELWLQTSQAEPATQPLRVDERALRELARAYSEAATANLKLLVLRAEGRQLPKRDPTDQIAGRLNVLLLSQRADYVQSHREDPGLDAALGLLGASFAAYRSSLASHSALEVATTPVVWGDEVRDTPEKARDATRNSLLSEEWLRARQGAGLCRNALGIIPTPVILATQIGSELAEGDAEDRETALEELSDATAMAQLAVALAAPSPGSASRGTEGFLPGLDGRAQEEAILACIDRLQHPQTGMLSKATGYAFNQGWRVRGDELRALFNTAVIDTCTRAKFLNDNIERYFWQVYKNAYITWWREVVVRERAAPKLTQTCAETSPTPEDDLLGHEACDLRRQAMGQLREDERRLIAWRFEEGLTDDEIAARLGPDVSREAARKRVERAVGRLRDIYKELDPLSLRLPRDWGRWPEQLWALNPLPILGVSPISRREMGIRQVF